MWPPWLSVPPAVLCGSPAGLGHVFPGRGALEVTGSMCSTQHWGGLLDATWQSRKAPEGLRTSLGGSTPSLPIFSSLRGSSRTPAVPRGGRGHSLAGTQSPKPVCFPRALTRVSDPVFTAGPAPGPCVGGWKMLSHGSSASTHCHRPGGHRGLACVLAAPGTDFTLFPKRGFGTTPSPFQLCDPQPPGVCQHCQSPLFPRGGVVGVVGSGAAMGTHSAPLPGEWQPG